MEWLFGYGALVPADLPRLPPGAVPCRLRGWRRTWGVAMDNAVDLPAYKHFVAPDGTRPALMVAFLDVVADAAAEVNGVALPVAPGELPGLDRRERNYRRVEVAGGPGGRAWMYVGRPDARERAAAGAREGRLVVARGYRERVLAGFRLLGEEDLFDALTGPSPPIADLAVVTDAPQAVPRANLPCVSPPDARG